MNLTPYHATYFAHELTKRCPSDSIEKLAGAVAGAQVDLNPHQVDAALFAFNSPLSKGALLADEVGLGKTIEAGLVLSQKWAERKRRILVIVPSNLRKQWFQELTEKFFLPCEILETKSYNAAVREGRFKPFERDAIVICSYQFARNKATDVAATPWELVVMDEAHRLQPSNVIANTLKLALANKNKLLLTATPLQNSLLELFGLVSFIDEHTFGDLKSFRDQFANLSQEQVFQTLKARLKPICHRTLRRQVTSYIPFTKRLPMVEEFTPEEWLMRLTAYELQGHAEFLDESSFRLNSLPEAIRARAAADADLPLGHYELPRRSGEAHLYRLNHPLAEAVLAQAKARELPVQEVCFTCGDHEGIITILEPCVGKAGWLTLSSFTVESLDQSEDYVIFGATVDDGTPLDEECAARLFTLPGKVTGPCLSIAPDTVAAAIKRQQAVIQISISGRNARFFEAEAGKLDGWADDLKLGLEREIKEVDRQIKEARRSATTALTLEEKLAGQKQIKALESQRNDKRRSLFEAQDKVDHQRETLIASIEGKLTQRAHLKPVFTIRWKLA